MFWCASKRLYQTIFLYTLYINDHNNCCKSSDNASKINKNRINMKLFKAIALLENPNSYFEPLIRF